MTRREAWAVAIAAGSAGIAIAVSTAAPHANSALAGANGVGGVVALVQRGFGDGRIVSASVDGSVLTVKLAVPRATDQLTADDFQEKAEFEARVLAHAVADWMRTQGEEPIATVRYRDTRGRALPATLLGGDPVESDPKVSSLPAGACASAARAAARPLLTLVSAQTLPYIKGTCVFRFRTSDPVAGSGVSMDALLTIIHALGEPDYRPWFYEIDDRNGTPQVGASWMPGENGATWARPGLSYALAHE
jgi:hypothetical protein